MNDLTGMKFGRLTVIERAGRQNSYARWKCECECGNLTYVSSNNLTNNLVKSCGCLKSEKNKERGRTIGIENLSSDLHDGTRIKSLIKNEPNKNNKTGYRGVHFSKAFNKYVAEINLKNQRYFIGVFDTAIEASLAYNKYKDQLHEEYLKKLKRENSELYYKSLPKDIKKTLELYDEKKDAESIAREMGKNVESVNEIIEKYGIKRGHKGRYVDLSNMKFGRLTVVRETNRRRHGYVVWECNCECGNCTYATTYELTGGRKKSCGCLAKETAANNGKEALSRWRESNFIDGKRIDTIIGEKVQKNNTSGYTGVYKTNSGKWMAQIIFGGERYYLGRYETADEAAKAKEAAKEQISGDFIKWYAETYPEKWERLQRKAKEKKEVQID